MDAATAEVLDLLVTAFKPGDAELRRIFAHDLVGDPGCPPEHRVVLREGDRPVAALLIFRRVLQLGRVEVPTACIGAVATAPDRRGLGLGGRLMDAAHRRCLELGLPWTFLLGIDHFYHRRGYRPCLAEDRVGVPLDHLPAVAGPAVAGPAVAEPATGADVSELIALGAAALAGGAWLRGRTPETFAAQLARAGLAWSDLMVLRRAGRIDAYFLRRGDLLWEAGARDAEAAAWIWSTAGAALRHEQPAAATLGLIAGAGHPCRRVLAGGPHRSQLSYLAHGGALGLVLDEPAFANALLPELAARVAACGGDGVTVEISGRRYASGGPRPWSVACPDAGTFLTAISGVTPVGNLPVAGDPTQLAALFPLRGNGFTRLENF